MMTKRNWKTATLAFAMIAGASPMLATNSVAAQIEAKEQAPNTDVGGWAVKFDASGKFVAVDRSAIKGGNSDWSSYLSRPVMAILVTSPSGAIQFEGVFDLESLTARDLNMNGSAEKGTNVDNTALNHIIQELTVKYQATENVYLKAGLGTPTFGVGRSDRGDRDVFSTRPLQAQYAELRERLFAEVGVELGSGTTMHVAVFDGTQQAAIDPNGKFKANDFADIDLNAGRLQDSASVAATLEQKLGNTGLTAVVSYAHIRELTAGANDQDRIAMGLKGQWALQNWTISALYQFTKVFDQVNLQSHLAEVQARNGKLALYLRGEYTEQQAGAGISKTKAATAGISYELVKTENMTLSPFVELLASKTDGQDVNLGVAAGVSASFGASIGGGSKSE